MKKLFWMLIPFLLSTCEPLPIAAQTVTVMGNTGTELQWNAVAGVDGYNVYRNGVKLNAAPIVTPGYIDSTARQGGSYSYTVTATKGTVESSPSNLIRVTLPILTAQPSPPAPVPTADFSVIFKPGGKLTELKITRRKGNTSTVAACTLNQSTSSEVLK